MISIDVRVQYACECAMETNLFLCLPQKYDDKKRHTAVKKVEV